MIRPRQQCIVIAKLRQAAQPLAGFSFTALQVESLILPEPRTLTRMQVHADRRDKRTRPASIAVALNALAQLPKRREHARRQPAIIVLRRALDPDAAVPA